MEGAERILELEGAERILELEGEGCFRFFWDKANTKTDSPGYGLVLDTDKDLRRASIASVGFGLSAIIIGVERGWITYDEGYERTFKTLTTLFENVDHYRGFYAHFVDINTGERINNCEFSIIDTSIVLNGAITSGEYFGGKIKKLANEIYERVDWNFIVDDKNNRFFMHYWPQGYKDGNLGLGGQWDYYAEQLMMYILAAGSPTSPVGPCLYYNMGKLLGEYNGEIYIRGWNNAIFIHQFSHAWFDSARYVDRNGINWFRNSVKATLQNRQYCIDNPEGFKTYNSNSWGLTACMGPNGYSGQYGPSPSGLLEEVNKNDGTVPPCGAAGSLPFTPKESIEALCYMYESFPKLWGKYGFYDSYNLDQDSPWFSNQYVGINKGITLLMIENYRSGLIWNYYMKNEYVKKGLEVLMFKKINDKNLQAQNVA